MPRAGSSAASSLLDALLADESASRLDRTDVAQPALFTLQASLVELWRAWGIEADVVIGHSVGEAAAAWTAGIFDLEGILRVILAPQPLAGDDAWPRPDAGRGHSAWKRPARGSRQFAGRINIAAFNAPRQVTLSGDAERAGRDRGGARRRRRCSTDS